jgi:hypothetical protein
LSVLAAKIQDDDRGGIHVLVFQPFGVEARPVFLYAALDTTACGGFLLRKAA